MKKKIYLGDAVYLTFQPGGYLLTAEDGVIAYEKIFLERDVLDRLIENVGCKECLKRDQNINDFEAGC